MSESLKKLYHDLIMDHQRNPVGFKKRDEADIVIDAYNPVCGDKFTLYLDLENNKVSQASFHGYGCALSKAATSLLMASLPGKNLEQCQQLIESYLYELRYDSSGAEEIVKALSVALKYPGREQCVVLSWETLLKFIEARLT